MRWTKSARMGTGVGAALIALTLIGCGLGSSSDGGSGGVAQAPSSLPAVVSDSPSPTPDPAPSPTKSPKAPKPTHSKTPSPAPTRRDRPLACPKQPETTGKPQSTKTVLAELTKASKVNAYYANHIDPASLAGNNLHGKLPDVHIPLVMLKAVAAQESSWTSNCVSRDGNGGYGVMQMEPGAAEQANTKFHSSLDYKNANENIVLGNQWLEWLTVHFGILYFHNDFSLENSKLRDVVLAAYNVGPDGVIVNGKIHIGKYGTTYYSSVVGLMQSWQPCQKSWGR